MKKNTIITLLFIIAIVIIYIAVLYPRNLLDIIGRTPNVDTNVHLTLIYRNSILDSGTVAETYNQDYSKEILNYLKSYKYKRTNISFKELDNVEYFIIMINDGEQIFRAAVRGDKHLSVTDENGKWSIYEVSGDRFDLGFLREFYKSVELHS